MPVMLLSPPAPRIIRPQPGPQERFLASAADIAIAGGAAGVGKTWALLLEPLRHIDNAEFGAVIFRRESPQITNEGGLWDESEKLYPTLHAQPRTSPALEWKFPSGMKVRFAHMQYEKDRQAWDGSQIPLIGFDQLEHFLEGQFWYMLSRNRSMCGVRPYVRATCNPVLDDDPVGGWLARLIAWWIDQDTGYPIWERSGVVRWFVRLDNHIHWADSREALIAQFPDVLATDLQPKSLTFIPGRLEDNPALMKADPGYRANLLAMPLVERERLLGGNWKVRPAAGKVFNRAWFEIVDAAPAEAQRVRAWDKAGTEGGGDWTVGLRMARAESGVFYVEDVVRGQWASRARNAVIKQTAQLDGVSVEIVLEREPSSAGKESAEISIRDLAGYRVSAKSATHDKLTRAYPFSAQAEALNVKFLRGRWNEELLNELHNFTGKDGRTDDQVDAASLAFTNLALTLGPMRIWSVGSGDDEQDHDAIEAERLKAAEQVVLDAIKVGGAYWPGGR